MKTPTLSEQKLFELAQQTLSAADDLPILLVGPHGSGQTLLARRIAMVVGGITSISEDNPYVLRAPHHTVSLRGIEGTCGHPGELARAEHGTLYLEDAPEFRPDVLRSVAAWYKSNTHHSTLVLGAASCPCGNLGRPDVTCACTYAQVEHYLDRVYRHLPDVHRMQLQSLFVLTNS